MELYLDQLHSFKLMRKHESHLPAWLTFARLLLDPGNPLQVRIPETLLYGYAPTPQLIYTGSKGIKVVSNATLQHLSDFTKLCGSGQGADFRTPLCVARQDGNTALVMDTLGVASLWHRSTMNKKQLALQRYILSPSGRQLVAQARWKAGKTRVEVFASKHPHFDRHSFMKLSTAVGIQERFLPTADTWQSQSECSNLDQLIDMMDVMAYHLRRYFSASNFSEVDEFCCAFVLDGTGNWYLLRICYYELDRKPKTLNKAMLQRTMVSKSTPVSRSPSPKKTRKEPYPCKPLTFEVSPFELKQAVKFFDHRIRIRRQVSHVKRSITTKSLNTSFTLTKLQLEEAMDPDQSKKGEEMLPIFQFPTPKTPLQSGLKRRTSPGLDDDGLRLMNCPLPDRISLIREHIIRQNNSLYTRIHYQSELPEERFLREAYKSAMDKVLEEMETLVSKVKLARVSMNEMRSRE
jgi:hypothetical protein